MLKQKSGCVVSITAALADWPIAGLNDSISMITKGGLNAATVVEAVLYLAQAGHVSERFSTWMVPLRVVGGKK
jgi:hypothetical protein